MGLKYEPASEPLQVAYGYFGDRSVDPSWIPSQLKATATGAFPYVAPVSSKPQTIYTCI